MKNRNMDYLKVSEGTVNVLDKMEKDEKRRLEAMLSKELNSEKDAYDNIVEMKEFLSKPHDYIPDAEQKINEKLFAIQNILGKEVLDKGIEVYEMQDASKEIYYGMAVEKRIVIEQKIMQDPKLAEQLSALYYNPQWSKIQKGEIILYQAVYAKMMEEERTNRYEEKINNSKEEQTPQER